MNETRPKRRTALLVGGFLLAVVGGSIFLLWPLTPVVAQWHEVTTKDGVCSVEMPGAAEQKTSESNTGDERVLTDEWILRTRRGDEYILSCAESPNFRKMQAVKLAGSLRSLVLQGAQRYGKPVELLGEKTIECNGHKATEWTIQAGVKLLRLRVCMVDGKVYQAFSVTSKD
jgi:hypothetical protein